MKKPRIIIVDTDEKYVVSLQHKFAKDYLDLIDLEVITDSNYLSEMLMIPQRAQILIISEKMYVEDLNKHDISKIFIMQEQYTDEQDSEANIMKIFKYSSIQEIVNQIINKCEDIFNFDNENNKDTQIIAITSAQGAIGKTTLSMGISVCLAKSFKKVLYIEASELQTFQFYLNESYPIIQADVFARIIENRQKCYYELKKIIGKEVFDYIPPFKASLLALDLNKDIFFSIIQQAKESKEYDYIIVDTSTVFDEFLVNLIAISNKTIFLLQQDVYSVKAMNAMMSNLNGFSYEKYVHICNKYNKNKKNYLLSKKMNVRFSVSEYIEEIQNGNDKSISIEEIAENIGVKKLAYLVS